MNKLSALALALALVAPSSIALANDSKPVAATEAKKDKHAEHKKHDKKHAEKHADKKAAEATEAAPAEAAPAAEEAK